MRCERFERLLSRYVDNELDPDLAASANEHVRVCMVCEARLAQYQQMREMLRSAGRAVPELTETQEDYWTLLKGRLEEPATPSNILSGPWKWPVTSTAAAAVLIGALVWIPSWGSRTPPPPEPPVAVNPLEEVERPDDVSPPERRLPHRGIGVVPVGPEPHWPRQAPRVEGSQDQEMVWF